MTKCTYNTCISCIFNSFLGMVTQCRKNTKHIDQISEHRWLTRTSIVPRLRARSKAAFTLASSWCHAAISERICFILIFTSLIVVASLTTPTFLSKTSLNQPGNHNQSSTSQVATDAAPPQFFTSAATSSRTLVLQQEKLLLYSGNS